MKLNRIAVCFLSAACVLLAASCNPLLLFGPRVAEVTIDPGEGMYPTGIVIARLSCGEEGATIRYTTDGKNPTETSPVYPSEGVPVNKTMVLKAKAFKEGLRPSPLAEAGYTIVDRGETIRGEFYADLYFTIPLNQRTQKRFTPLGIYAWYYDNTGKDYSEWVGDYVTYHDPVTNEFAITGIPTGADSGLQIIGYFKHTDDSVNEVRPGDFILQGKERRMDIGRPA